MTASLYLNPQGASQYDRTKGPPEHTWRWDWTPYSCSLNPPDLKQEHKWMSVTKELTIHDKSWFITKCKVCLAPFHNLMKIKIPSIHSLPWIKNAGHIQDKIISLHQNHNCVSTGFDKSIKRTPGIFCSPLNNVVDHFNGNSYSTFSYSTLDMDL